MRHNLSGRSGLYGVRLLVTALAGAALVGLAGLAWFVVISWDVLRRSIGLAPLLLLLVVAAVVSATWASTLLRLARRPRHPMSPRRAVGVAAVTLLATVTGLVAVPTTRDRLEANKCRHLVASDAASQAGCRTWLESRRQWWTLGLSHKNPPRH